MESLVSGTLAGAGWFSCDQCGEVVTLAAGQALGTCANCGGTTFTRTSLFAAGRFAARERATREDDLTRAARAAIAGEGRYLAFDDGGQVQVVSIGDTPTRIGRSMAADVRFDDATVSRRHAIVVADEEGVRVLDDRSLNGVFVNGRRVETHLLRNGDELVIGRHRLRYLEAVAAPQTSDVRIGWAVG